MAPRKRETIKIWWYFSPSAISYTREMLYAMVQTMHKYAIETFYSEEDEGYIAIVPELAGCSAFGKTEEEALKEIKVAMELWLETAKKEGGKMPQPQGKELLKTFCEERGGFRITRLQKADV